jgi:hypothetical protein
MPRKVDANPITFILKILNQSPEACCRRATRRRLASCRSPAGRERRGACECETRVQLRHKSRATTCRRLGGGESGGKTHRRRDQRSNSYSASG